MPRGGRRNYGYQNQQQREGPPGFDPSPRFQPQQFDSGLTGNPVVDFAPGLHQTQFYGAPPGFETHFPPQGGPSFPLFGHPPNNAFVPNIQQSIQSLQIGESNEEQAESADPQQSDSKQQKASSSNRQNNRGNQPHTHRSVPFKGSTEECILCCQRSDIFGVGICKHPACIECIIRMRSLGESTTCHACRDEIPLMYFVQKPKKWEEFKLPECKIVHPDCEKYGIAFENQHAADVYNDLNAFVCHVCQRQGIFADFPNFGALKQHIGTAHQLFYCHICIDHLNILPKNHRTFRKNDLQMHMTGAKSVVKGVNGHPKCDFCNARFFDVEELYKHSRKEHFYCGICSETVGTNSFFKTIKQLHGHYKTKHHPCLDPECVDLGIVFSDEFDLNVHKTERHGEGNRQIPIEFQFSRGQSRYNEPPNRLATQRQGVSVVPSNYPPLQPPVTIIPSALTVSRNVQIVHRPTIVEQHDFPTLSALNNAPNAYNPGSNWRAEVSAARSQAQRRPEPPNPRSQIGSASHFPTLSGPTSSSSNSNARNNIWGGGKAVAIVKKAPKPRAPSPPKPVRKKIIPSAEVWTENMRLKLEAREKGLPEPPDIEPKIP
ncbi:RING-type E3 ubiquitin transferase [Aphelenchoides bicaudatus]|nr:RING-type E3 ubiquitin transferase [Aphelenchoides bicaudatus]